MGIMNLFSSANPTAAAAETVINGIASIFDVILKPNMTIEELAGVYSDKLDEIILKEKANNLQYVGGSLNVNCVNAAQFEVAYELYFQDKNKEWIKKEAKSKPQNLSYLKPESAAELRQKKKVTFEIEPPEEKSDNKQGKKDVSV
ncbi:MAG: hypothetical protein IKN12_06990 [Selenomonadaceae bacterium]|nr:hypothetical protein [Selenomonadaceae bacterium]